MFLLQNLLGMCSDPLHIRRCLSIEVYECHECMRLYNWPSKNCLARPASVLEYPCMHG